VLSGAVDWSVGPPAWEADAHLAKTRWPPVSADSLRFIGLLRPTSANTNGFRNPDPIARDVADELARQNVASENDFEWTSQLRWGPRDRAFHQGSGSRVYLLINVG
jgi:hypothetical protein